MSDDEDWRNRAVAVVTLLVLGAGFLAIFLGISRFWIVWVLGFAVVVPLLSVLLGVEDDSESDVEPAAEPVSERSDSRNALETLRDRYARGELTDEQFERKLERLLETETIEDVEDARRRVDADRVGDGADARNGRRNRTERER
ncbi:SHOCT domain-containing protein [Natronomonas salina]|uniref:SHOCT domain-containing protein n=1 Tax=Natronomonas salina TaxID=1710540 RepID=UPI0015B5EFBE|nr:SHOCT domain-containing protein [Natronomonas salina]QLD87767.1 SHOCT domain-containing protein [Natronomonas salina]